MFYLIAVSVFVCQEIVGLIVFPILTRRMDPNKGNLLDWVAISKGMFERFVLLTWLLHGYSEMLIAVGGMKLGTRLHEEQGVKLSNTYFLIGNLLSMMLAILGAVVTEALWETD